MLVFDAMNCSRLEPSYVAKLREGGVHALHTSVIWGERIGLRATLCALARCLNDLEDLAPDLVLGLSAEEIQGAGATNRIAVILGLQNTTPLEDDEMLLDVFHRLGVRVVQLTYNERNLAGDGCRNRRDAGLSDFGVRLVRRLNKLRIAIDVSHAGERTLMDTIAESRTPVICSHANSAALCDSPRNLSDRAILAIADARGVIGITSIGHFVSTTSPTLENMLDHIDHVVRLVGPDHVAIGSDLFEGRHRDVYEMVVTLARPYGLGREFFQPQAPEAGYADPSWARRAVGLQSVVDFPNIISGLIRRGYDRQQIAQIMGGNLLRVLGEIWGG